MSKMKSNDELIEKNTSESPPSSKKNFTSVVAAHYNTLEDKGLDARNKSRIVYLRNFNNWIKSMLINEFAAKYKKNTQCESINVLDMCCGKGGDLLKWKNNDVKHVICVDVAKISVEQCEQRYNEMKERTFNSKHKNIFSAEFIVADCTKVRLKDYFQKKNQLLDIVSCQFSFHYSFESLSQAECMIRNAAENLRSGGFFIGTIPDANDIVLRQKKVNQTTFGNDIFKIQFICDVKKQFPLFGAKYEFFLEDVVNCPEFLVHFPTFIKLAEKFGLKLVKKERFFDFYNRMKEEGRGLLGRMQALQAYPPFDDAEGQRNKNEYIHAETYLKENPLCNRVGTLSFSEWEVGCKDFKFNH
ncbi:hypothetical protein PGB90_007675 [Kerria lacca]